MPSSVPSIEPLGDSALVIDLGTAADEATSRRVRGATLRLTAATLPGVVEIVPTLTSVAIILDPARRDADRLHAAIEAAIADLDADMSPPPRVVESPVCYGGDEGPDLAVVASNAGLTAAEVVRLHTSAGHVVGMIGFVPGFPYLLGLPASLALPRRATPRTSVPAGSVAIAERQTGIYPRSGPGGWHIIGRTELAMFDHRRDPPTLLEPGDIVRFVPVESSRGA